MKNQRQVIDYALARRSLLGDLFAGRVSTLDVCDAHPYLLRAAKHHGELTHRDCPVCRRERLIEVTYVYSDALKESSGAARASRDVPRFAETLAEIRVYVVEVCRGCGWNHLVSSFVAGTSPVRVDRGSRTTAQRASRKTAGTRRPDPEAAHQ